MGFANVYIFSLTCVPNSFIIIKYRFSSFLFSQSSNMLNQARLKVLKVREDHVRSVLDEARRRLGEVTRDQERYSVILEKLVLQGLYQVLFHIFKIMVEKENKANSNVLNFTLNCMYLKLTKGMLY